MATAMSNGIVQPCGPSTKKKLPRRSAASKAKPGCAPTHCPGCSTSSLSNDSAPRSVARLNTFCAARGVAATALIAYAEAPAMPHRWAFQSRSPRVSPLRMSIVRIGSLLS
jgi:hypothetical protein